MAELPFTYVQISNGTDTLKAPANLLEVSNATSGVWVAEDGFKGYIEPGVSNAEAKGRSFANGSVLNIRNNFAGKVMNLSFVVSNPVKENMALIERLISTPIVSITSDWDDKIYTAQFQRDGYSCNWDRRTRSFIVSLIFACEEAF